VTNRRDQAATDARRRKFDRVRLLNEEVDRLTVDVEQRAASVSNKASFLAVAAGVIIAAAVAQLWTVLPWIGVLALGFACLGLVCATVALRPGRRIGLVAQRLADAYLDSELSASEIELLLVRRKSDVISARESDLVARAQWVASGLSALLVSVAALTIVFATQILGG